MGDRIVSASMKDGTVRIWSFTKDYSKEDHIMLVMSNDDTETAQRGGGRGPNNKKKINPEVRSGCICLRPTFVYCTSISTTYNTPYPIYALYFYDART